MVDLIAELPNLFRERYLNTHEKYLKSIADISSILYFKEGDNLEYGCELIVNKLLSAGEFSESKYDEKFESKYFRNLRNAWYHELVLNSPEDDFDQRIKFAPWKIVQCYYSIIAGISALIRCFYTVKFDNHKKIAALFTNDFLNSNTRRNFFLPPFNYYLDQQGNFKASNEEIINWEYGIENHIPYIKECLRNIKNNQTARRISILHYLIKLRNWVQYEDAYLFFLLYGESVKENLDYSLKRLSYGYMVHVEFFFIKLFGWKYLEPQFDVFIEKVEDNLDIEPSNLIKRFCIYQDTLQD